MHLNQAISLCSAVALLIPSCMSLPADEYRLKALQELAPRATYSVVPIGGPGLGGSGGPGDSGGSGAGSGPGWGPGNPVTVTVVKTLPQKTWFRTVYVTSPPRTERVIETVIVTKTIQAVPISQDTKTTRTNSEQPISTAFPTSTIMSNPTSLFTTSTAGIPHQAGFIGTISSTSTISTQSDSKWHSSSHPSWNGTISRRGSRNRVQPQNLV